MKRVYLILFLTLSCILGYCSEDCSKLKAVIGLVDRVTGGRAGEFEIRICKTDSLDRFAYYADKGHIVLEGNNGVSIASALNAYLRNHCGWEYTWCGKPALLPAEFPLPETKVEQRSPYRYRYYLNYCTFNYTMSWWKEDRWQKEIDWMALHGINMPLALTGQNSVWQRVYRKLGLTDEQLKSFFSGPAYFNWFWMGNLDGWGGPLPQNFIEQHEKLQKKILQQERALGMIPILPAFTGHVPVALAEKYPEVKIKKTHWVNFPEVSILDPSEDLFTEIGSLYLEEQIKLFGTDHYYTADTFNENLPPSNDPSFLSSVSKKVYSSMSKVDPEAVWVMQGWMFHHDKNFWGESQIRALLAPVPDDKMLILDLWSERYPVWKQTSAYYGKPWIWCMLQNFGQNVNISGNATSIANEPALALADSCSGNMMGIGLTPEGIEHTPAIYALFLENVWSNKPLDIDEFLGKYLSRRYGKYSEHAFFAWKKIFATAFENTVNNGGHESIIVARPTFKANPRGCVNTNMCYERHELVEAWEELCGCMDEFSGSDAFRYDIVDITRQVLADFATDVQSRFIEAYYHGDKEAFLDSAEKFMGLLDAMDKLLATRHEFLLGRWLESAKAMAYNDDESALYEFNARNLITMWGNRDCSLHEYACRQWSGMVSGFYKDRWKLFFAHVLEYWRKFDQASFDEKCKDYEWNWVNGREIYPVETSGDELLEVRNIIAEFGKDLTTG